MAYTGYQTTLQAEIQLTGIGLHSGKEVSVRMLPAPANTGVVFRRIDLCESPEIPANFENIISTLMATTVGRGTATVSTTEHLLAAFAGCGLDNAIVEINASEVPVFDGSSEAFSKAILTVGLKNLPEPKQYVRIKRLVRVELDGKWGMVYPCERFEVASFVEWAHPIIGKQEYTFVEGRTRFSEISNCRTFGFLKEVESLRARGLAKGGSLKTAVVLDETRVLNEDGLRCKDEFVRHKVLDAIGDFRLAGFSILGRFELYKAGHELHRRLLDKIFSDPSHYEIIDSTALTNAESSVVRMNESSVEELPVSLNEITAEISADDAEESELFSPTSARFAG